MRTIIIEDEDLTAEDLCSTLKRLEPNTQLCARLTSVREAITYFKTDPPVDLIFSDIQLGDGESFDIFKTIPPKAPIVFCTAYNQYMMEAFQHFGLDYILKPFSDESIHKTLEKYRLLRQAFNKTTLDMVHSVNEGKIADRTKKSLIVIHGDKIIPVQISDIALCYIEFDNVFVKTHGGKEYLINKSLEEMEYLLGDGFFRVNRQHILNRDAIAFANLGLSRKLAINLHVDHPIKISVSKEKYHAFIQWLEG
ncbi:LytR/AlgR family response regulator transcription factor [Sphingobacterium sp. SGR-19]|uniref:LytR/AlgR family response regulator transcription factor n=1 Tax=Sphingobacterium sp. SGR-19 TaxID=2710886 RepID=UPI0013EBC636|nr:LytTR family DNA-binding domain-containing protein [Sphingobacterium sp. SGR-19]NGM66398.1 response regulator transcription factor [Sphingobacterium sp. SGR-19]